jgi:hypothetical protein
MNLIFKLGWLKGWLTFCVAIHFFCRVVCIYMILTWHKNNIFPNFWLDLDFKLKEKNIYREKNATYIYQIYNNGLLKLKNMDWFAICAFIYMHFCVWIFFGIYYGGLIYDMLLKNEHMCIKIARKIWTNKTLWTFEWPKMSHIFISPYHNHFWVNFN